MGIFCAFYTPSNKFVGEKQSETKKVFKKKPGHCCPADISTTVSV
jgi:hypothetical protein